MKEFSDLNPFIIVKSVLDFYLYKNKKSIYGSTSGYKSTTQEYLYKYLLDFFIDNKEKLMFEEYVVERYIILFANCYIERVDYSNPLFKFKIAVPFTFEFNFRVDDISPFIRKNKIEFALSDI